MISVGSSENGSTWNFEGKLAFVDQWFLMSSPLPMAVITLAYILFVLKIGPEYMKTRRQFSLKNVMVVYNIMQVFISSYLFYLSSRLMLCNGFVTKTCLLEKEETRHSISTIMYYYFLAKVTELLDTVFFVLRKKEIQITFLHVYHHAMMVIASWSILKYEPTFPTIFIRNINSFVHVIMYAYYGLSSFESLTKYLWWKKYITKLQLFLFKVIVTFTQSVFFLLLYHLSLLQDQLNRGKLEEDKHKLGQRLLVQFVLILIHFVITYTTSECTPSYPLCLTITINTTLFIFLFGKFYIESYSKKYNYNTNGRNKN